MKILITGGAGFIGFHLASLLISQGHYVDLIDIIDKSNFDKELKLLIENKNCQYFKLNLLENKETQNLKKDYNFIIHLAAIVGVENVMSNSYGVLTYNQLMLSNIIEFAKSTNKKPKLIFTSTSEVYAGSQFLNKIIYPTPEDNILSLPDLSHPRTSYMLSKIYGEAMCHTSGLDYLILRPHNIYGPRMGMKHVIPQLIHKIINTEKKGKLDLYSPDHTRTFCYVTYAIEKIADFINSEWSNGTFNLGVDEPEIKIRELASLLLKITNREDITLNELENTPGSPSRRVPDISRLNNKTKKSKIPSLTEGITQTYNWYSDWLLNNV